MANIQERIIRPEASSNRLVQATGARENITWAFDHIGVGDDDFLDRSQAFYWRKIEEGTSEFVGMQLYPMGPGKPPYPVAHHQFPGLRTYGGDGLPWMDGERYVVKRPIKAMNAYRDAFESFQPGRVAHEAVGKYLREIRALPILFGHGDD